jgi:cytochrome c553
VSARGRAAAVAAALALAAGVAAAQGADEARFAPCAACHGAGGVSTLPDTPSLAGQPSFYAITQLFLFRAERRSNAVVTAMAKPMSDADLRTYSELIGRLPAAPSVAAGPADPERVKRGAALAERHRCASCHGAGLAGGQQVPRLAGQREDYLARALAEFRAGSRVGYTPAMNETLAGLGAAELGDLAHYLAHAP